MNHLLASRRLLLLAAVASATPVLAQYTSLNRDVLTPNTGIWSAGGVTLGGTKFTNLGLQGVGYIPANTIDPVTGETVGSISDMQITGWAKNENGTYSGTFNFLPDRGYNSGSTFSNIGARINTFDFSFTPYTSNAVLTPPSGTQHATQQISTSFTGSTLFTYDHDGNSGTATVPTSGQLANAAFVPGAGVFAGVNIPTVSGNTTTPLLGGSTVANRLSLDAEGLVFDNRPGRSGTGWVSDEYGANIYHFNASKVIDGVLGVPAALVPHKPAGTPKYDVTPDNGRRDNQGFEGVTTSPDGNRLFTLLQSATIQDSGSGNQNRANAVRLLEYDISSTTAPTDPTHQYVIQLPRIDDNGATGGVAVNRAGAQSSIIALNDHQLLILSRDGNGRGASGSPVFKSILLADLNGATDIDGSFDGEAGLTTTGVGTGVLNPALTTITWTEALNLIGKLDLSVTELEQFGLNLSTAPGDLNTVSEKWEALFLVPANDPVAPNDYFLFVGNDNDFITASTKMYDGAGNLITIGSSAFENDSMVLAYRVSVEAVPEASTYGAGAAVMLAVGGLWWRRRARA